MLWLSTKSMLDIFFPILENEKLVQNFFDGSMEELETIIWEGDDDTDFHFTAPEAFGAIIHEIIIAESEIVTSNDVTIKWEVPAAEIMEKYLGIDEIIKLSPMRKNMLP